MSLLDGPLTGAPLSIPNSSLSAPNVTLYEMVTSQDNVGAPEGTPTLIEIFESAVEVSGDFSLAGTNTLTCEHAGKYLLSANIAVMNDGAQAAILKQANLDCAVNGVGQSAAVVRRASSAMYDTIGRLRRTLAIPQSMITLAVGDTVQFYFSYQDGTAGLQTYDLNIYDTNPGALAWAQLEHTG